MGFLGLIKRCNFHRSPRYQGYIEHDSFEYFEDTEGLIDEVLEFYRDHVKEVMQEHDILLLPDNVKKKDIVSLVKESMPKAAYAFESPVVDYYETHIHCYKYKDGEILEKYSLQEMQMKH